MGAETLTVVRGANGRFTSASSINRGQLTSVRTNSAVTQFTAEDVAAALRDMRDESFDSSFAKFRGVGRLLAGSAALKSAQFAAARSAEAGRPTEWIIESVYEAGVTFGLYLAGHSQDIPTD